MLHRQQVSATERRQHVALRRLQGQTQFGRVRRRTLLAGTGTGAATLFLAACGGSSNTSKTAGGSAATQIATQPASQGTAIPANSRSSPVSTAPTPSKSAQRGGTLNVPTSPLVAVLDPHQATQPNVLLVWHNISHHLIELDEQLQPTNLGVAQSWQVVDPQTLIFKLWPGIKFENKAPANGRAFTADDVVYSLQRISTPEARFARRAEFSFVDKFTAVDPLTVQIKLKQPYVPMLTFLGSLYNVMVNREAVEKYGDLQRPEANVGLGPFSLDTYDKESGFTLVRNPNYWRQGLPYLDKVQVTVFSDPAPQQAALRAGQIHFSDTLIRDVPTLIKSNSKLQQVKTAGVVLYEFGMNEAAKPFDDLRVRQAIHLILDRDKMLAAKYGARENGVYAAPLPVPLSPYALTESDLAQIAGYRQPKDQDIADAKKLMAAAGMENGFKIGAKTADQYTPDIEPFIPDLKSLLNIDITLQDLEWGAYKQAESLKQTEAFGTGYIVEAEPDANLRLYHYSTGTRNYVNFADPQADALIDKQSAEYDPNKRASLCHDAVKYLISQVPHGWHGGAGYSVRLIDPKVHGLVTPPASSIDRQDFTYTWIEK
jgi:peptide/nickel transport system substrate-binding protein